MEQYDHNNTENDVDHYKEISNNINSENIYSYQINNAYDIPTNQQQFEQKYQINNYKQENLNLENKQPQKHFINNNSINRNYSYNSYQNISNNNNDKMNKTCPIIYNSNNSYNNSPRSSEINPNNKSVKSSIDVNNKNYIHNYYPNVNNQISGNHKGDGLFEKETQKKLQELDNSISHLNAKNASLSKCIESIKNNNQPNYINQSNNNSLLMYEMQRLKGDQTSLISDNIIFREDINRLADINHHLEMELHTQRQRNYELAAENDKLHKENLNYRFQIEKTNNIITQVKAREAQIMDNINQRLVIENKMRDTDYELKTIRDKYSELQIQYNLLHNNYDGLVVQKEKSQNDLNMLSKIQNEKIMEIELKLNAMAHEIDSLRKENDSLRMETERYRNALKEVEKGRDEFKDKYHEQKCRNDLLEGKIVEITKEFDKYKEDVEGSEIRRMKEEELKKEKIEAKKSLVNELQRKINDYKNSRLKSKNNMDNLNE